MRTDAFGNTAPADLGRARNHTVDLAVVGLSVVVLAVHFLWLQVVAEDAYITFRFSQNLASSEGLVWNAGEPPVEGYTNFLWVIVGAVVIRLGLDIALVSQVLGFLAAVGTVVIVYDWARRHLVMPPLLAAIPLSFLVASGPFAAWAGSGMETTIFGFLITLGCYMFVNYWREADHQQLLWASLAFVLAAMTRPEGVVVFCILGALGLLLSLGGDRHRWQHFMVPLAVFLVLFGAYFLWRYSYFGWLLPNTFYAKTGGGLDQMKRGIRYAMLFYLYFVAPMGLVLIALLVAGRAPLKQRLSALRPSEILSAPLAWGRRNVAWLAPLVVVAVYSAYIAVVGGDYMAMFRFFAPITPLICLVGGAALAALWRDVRGPLPGAALAVALALVVVQSTPLEARLFPPIPRNHGTWRGVEVERWHVARLLLIGHHFDGTRTSYEDSVATDAIGAIAYVADMKVFDTLGGLVDEHIAHKKFAPGELGSGLPGHERQDMDYIFAERQPTYFMYNRELTDKPLGRLPKLKGQAAEIAAKDYEPVSVLLEDEQNGETGYFTYLRRVAP